MKNRIWKAIVELIAIYNIMCSNLAEWFQYVTLHYEHEKKNIISVSMDPVPQLRERRMKCQSREGTKSDDKTRLKFSLSDRNFIRRIGGGVCDHRMRQPLKQCLAIICSL
jgi:hypothetical protein